MPESSAGVRNDSGASRFTVEEDGVEAQLLYRQHGSRLVLIHTEVPDALGGRGIGSRLVRAALEYAQAEHLTVVPWCPFARQWLTDHPGEADSVSMDWDTLPPPEGGAGG